MPPPRLRGVHTPLKVEAWTSRLRGHPDQRFAAYLLQGITEGFRIGFRPGSPLVSAERNMPSAGEHAHVVSDYLREEVSKRRMLGPFSPEVMGQVHCSRFGVIPKSQPGKWRLITDLSHPSGRSVNDGIDKELSSLSYTTVDAVSRQIMKLGRGALMAKADIRSVYRLIPVHAMDRWLLGMRWDGLLFVDSQLPFGLRSAPKIFTAVADAIEWCMRQRGVEFIEHYLDDYIVFGPPESRTCSSNLTTLLEECEVLGAPMAEEKTEGPATVLTFLGIEIDTREACLRLPQDKLTRLRQTTEEWAQRKSCRKKELESLIGVLQFACKVIRPGRSFLRRLIILLSSVRSEFHMIRLNAEFRSDLKWWRSFAALWNGVALVENGSEVVALATDASGSWGAGGWSDKRWFQFQWPPPTSAMPIAVKELVPIAVALAVWGRGWACQRVLCHCDNTAAVAAVQSRYSRHPVMAAILRCMFFMEARFHCSLSATHVPGVLNDRADDLSRN